MTNPIIISVDPGHTAWCIAHRLAIADSYRTHPRDYGYIQGKEKPKSIGCPETVRQLVKIIGEPGATHYNQIVIVVEQAISNYPYATASLNKDIGYIAGAFYWYKNVVVLPCQASDWKKHLESFGFLPPKSGAIKPDRYCPILNKHFDMNFNDNQWAAWGLVKWAFDNILSPEAHNETD